MEFPRQESYPQLEKKGVCVIKACIFSRLLKNTFESIKCHFTCPEQYNAMLAY